ncbi:uncharacterized protein LOC131077850 isoform X1 [Cryptomeria japonica]|uniref:uncharacterized protein LOC131077850 isoform X1 n=1 Tax=Cryptomeria japonica TaxID=3369 RepID=UPI0027DA4302|nr:uncharacterized protein LOC131077850 isoform X1 [Cryptomeria japonica]
MARNLSFEIYSSPDGSNFARRGTSLHGENSPPSQVLRLDKLSMGDQTYHCHPELKKVTNAVVGTGAENSSLGLLQAKPLSSLGVEELKQVRSCVTENSLKAREQINVLKEPIYKLDTCHRSMLARLRSQIELPAPVPNKQVYTSMMDMQVEGHPNNLPKPSETIGSERYNLRSNIPNKKHAASPTKGKGSHAFAKSMPNVSHTSHTFDSQQQTSNPNRGQITGGSNSCKHPFSTGSSSTPVTEWAEQKPPKHQHTKRTNLVPPVSNHVDLPNILEGSLILESVAKPDSTEISGQAILRCSSNNNAFQQSKLKFENISSLAAFSESKESGAGDKCKNKIKKQGDVDEKIAPVCQNVGSLVLPLIEAKTIIKIESGGGVQRPGRSGRVSVPLRMNAPLSGKLEYPATTKQLRSTRLGTDKLASKPGQPPTKKKSLDRKPVTWPSCPMNSGLSDFTGDLDDSEELLAAVNASNNASEVACSGPFWKQMEPFFAPVTPDNQGFLKQQVQIREVEDEDAILISPGSNPTEEVDLICSMLPANPSPISSCNQRSLVNVCVDNESLKPSSNLNAKEDIKRPGKFRYFDRMYPLSERLLSALIGEEDSEETNGKLYDGPQDDCLHCTSEDSPCGSCTQIESDSENAGKVELEIEPEVEMKNLKHNILDYSNYKSHFANGLQNHVAENICSADLRQDDIEVPSEILGFNVEHRVLDERHAHGGKKNQGKLQSSCQTFGLISGIAADDIQYEEMDLNQRILLELQSIGLYPESVPDLAQREDEEIKTEICKLKDELRQQVSKNKRHLHKLEKAVFKRQKVEDREHEVLAMNKLVESAYNRHMALQDTNASGHKSAQNKVTKQATLGFVKPTLAKCRMFEETGKICFSDTSLNERMFSISLKEMNNKLLGDAVNGDTANVLAVNAHALSDIKTSDELNMI